MQRTNKVLVDQVYSHVCDRCGREEAADSMEGQEFTHVSFVGGYSSIIGDGAHVSIDLCQHCLTATLGPWLQVTPSSY